MADVFQILLNAPGCSGRGVRYRTLTPTEHDDVQAKAAKLVSNGGTVVNPSPFDLRITELREGVKTMLVSVTRKTGLVTADEMLALTEADWLPLNVASLETGDQSYDKLFTPKDDGFLSSAYRRNNEVTLQEVELILGKALPVSVG